VKNANILDFYNNIQLNDFDSAFVNMLIQQNMDKTTNKGNALKAINDFVIGEDLPKAKLLSEMPVEAMKYFQENEGILNSLWDNEIEAAVISIDIRKSTELMLKADDNLKFSAFITEIVEELILIIKKNYGIIEKFTGDGVLAFFPKNYSGENSVLHVVNAAYECHEKFNDVYSKHRNNFAAVLSNTGLGIGIDYGKIVIKNINRAINIIGRPVVYACRMSGISAKKTALNVKAYEEVYKVTGNTQIFYPEELSLKTGEILKCYCIDKKIETELIKPKWVLSK
jgi:class 3 adenylate cyclase